MQKRQTNRKQYFAELAQTCEKYFLPFIEKHTQITSKLNVLEIGCGEGGNLLPFSKRGCKVTGIDIAAIRIDEATHFFHEEGLKGNFLCQDIFSTEIKSKFDIIIIHDVIEHVMQKEELLTISARLLNNNGLIYVGFPPWQMPFGGHQQLCSSRILSSLPFVHLLPEKAYKKVLENMGESQQRVNELIEIKNCKTTIEHFRKLVKEANLTQVEEVYYFINPHYESKFGLKPRKTISLISVVPVLRNFFTTSYFTILK